MGKGWKLRVSRMFSCNYDLNRKVLQLKCSWDEVRRMLGNCKRKC